MTETSVALVALALAAVGTATTCALLALRSARRTRRLAADAQRYAAVVESASDAVITIDREQRIVVFNAAAEHLLGCPREQALGTPIDRFIPTAAAGARRPRQRRRARTRR